MHYNVVQLKNLFGEGRKISALSDS